MNPLRPNMVTTALLKTYNKFKEATKNGIKPPLLIIDEKGISKTKRAIRNNHDLLEILVYGKARPKKTEARELTEIYDIQIINVKSYVAWDKGGEN